MAFLMKQLESKSVNQLAKDIGMPVQTLWRIKEGQRYGSIRSGEKIDAYRQKLIDGLIDG